MSRTTAISRARKQSNSRHKGAALYAVVLIIGLLLAAMSAVAVQMFGQSARIERWQADRLADINLETIARSAAESATELFIADGLPSGITIGNAISSDVCDINDTHLVISVSGANSHDFTVIAVASNDKTQMSISVKNTYSDDKYLSKWSSPKWMKSK